MRPIPVLLIAHAMPLFAIAALPACGLAQDADPAALEEEFGRYDITEGGWLSGTELDACDCREHDADGDGEVTKAEFMAGRSRSTVDAGPGGDAVADPEPAIAIREWRVGDFVEAYINVDWLPATIVQIGGGPFPDDPYLVRYGEAIGGIHPTRWLGPDDIRPMAKEPEAEAGAEGPRPERYTILSYGNPAQPPLRLGAIELQPGHMYRYLDGAGNLLGAGEYGYDAADSSVHWQTGILSEQGWGGEFTIERDGRTHKIRLMRSTIAVHSTD